MLVSAQKADASCPEYPSQNFIPSFVTVVRLSLCQLPQIPSCFPLCVCLESMVNHSRRQLYNYFRFSAAAGVPFRELACSAAIIANRGRLCPLAIRRAALHGRHNDICHTPRSTVPFGHKAPLGGPPRVWGRTRDISDSMAFEPDMNRQLISMARRGRSGEAGSMFFVLWPLSWVGH